MDLSILQKVNDLASQGKSQDQIRIELQTEGLSLDNINEALKETNTSGANNSEVPQSVPMTHHEKVIQPTPGFDPNAK